MLTPEQELNLINFKADLMSRCDDVPGVEEFVQKEVAKYKKRLIEADKEN